MTNRKMQEPASPGPGWNSGCSVRLKNVVSSEFLQAKSFIVQLDLASRLSEPNPVTPDSHAQQNLEEKVTTYEGEFLFTVAMLERRGLITLPHQRFLDVGAGVGLVSLFLASQGHTVVAVEPSATGFGFMSQLQEAAIEGYKAAGFSQLPSFINEPIEDITELEEESFDVAFSANVLEHVEDPGEALNAIHAVVKPGGVHVHVCPNYSFPYEPHFAMPLVPFIPKRTELFLSKAVRQSELWKSLNFVKQRNIKKWADSADVAVRFDSHSMSRALQRMTDEIFSSRHTVIRALLRWIPRPLVRWIFDRVPTSIQSPMEFEVRKVSPLA